MSLASKGRLTSHWTERLATLVLQHPVGDFPQRTLKQASLVLADTIASTIAGLHEPEIAQLAARIPIGDQAALVGQSRLASVEDAAFFAATAGCAVEIDEGNYASGGHPGIHIVPVALAEGEALGRSGLEILDALIVGYEIGSRVGRACNPNPLIHSNGTWGTIGAAATVSRLRRFDVSQMQQAICAAASLCTATSSSTSKSGASIRSVWGGLSARHGLLACNLIECGFSPELTAIETVFGGILGVDFDPSAALAGWGDLWEIDHNFFKFDACCKETQGALYAVSSLLAQTEGQLRPSEIQSIRVDTFDEAALLNECYPRSPLAARFSIPFMVASRLLYGRSGVSSEEVREILSDPAVLALAARVEVTEDPMLTSLVPIERRTRLRITTFNGNTLVSEVKGSLGDYDLPFDESLIRDKFTKIIEKSWLSGSGALFGAVMDFRMSLEVTSLTRHLI